ncbi:MAG: hypothetical protein JKY65_11950 [Planctomycetes bacterium]|nr:hypothetical protein [Planctomycetota bacterium]
MSETLIHRRVAAAQSGDNPTVVCRVPSGWVVIGDVQVVKGYSLLLPDPVVPTLNDLSGAARARYLEDMGLIGDALLALTGAARVNYAMLGNLEPALHCHLFPRYTDEPDDLRNGAVWSYDWDAARPFDLETDRPFMDELRAEIERRLA